MTLSVRFFWTTSVPSPFDSFDFGAVGGAFWFRFFCFLFFVFFGGSILGGVSISRETSSCCLGVGLSLPNNPKQGPIILYNMRKNNGI